MIKKTDTVLVLFAMHKKINTIFFFKFILLSKYVPRHINTWVQEHICIILGQIYELKWNRVFNIYLNGAVLMITLRVNLCKIKLIICINSPNEGVRRRKMSTRSAILEIATSFVLTTENLGRHCRSPVLWYSVGVVYHGINGSIFVLLWALAILYCKYILAFVGFW